MDGFDGQRITKVKVPTEIELSDGTVIVGDLFCSPQGRLSDLLNDPRTFLPVETTGARIVMLNKAVIARVTPLNQRSSGPVGNDPYAILGISDEATNDEVKLAYRRLVRDTHPDRVGALGLPGEFVDLANRRMARFNEAYARIRKKRGIVEAS